MTAPLSPTPELAAYSGTSSATPGHTIGPFFHDALGWAASRGTTDNAGHGEIRIEGRIEDGQGQALPAWLIEVWAPQALAAETAAGLDTPGLRRVMNDDQGRFAFRVPAPEAGQPAALITLFGLGLTRHQFTAVFLDASSADDAGSVLAAVPAARRGSLVAERVGDGQYGWTIRTQGERETVFLDYR